MNCKLLSQIQICRQSVELIVKALSERAKDPYAHIKPCPSYCPNADVYSQQLYELNELLLQDNQNEVSKVLLFWRERIKSTNNCVNIEAFGAIRSILDLLFAKNQNNSSCKFFISHSSEDRAIVDGFIKNILMLGCGFRKSDIFCTLDPTSIRTGDDFREKIVENMKACDYILLFVSKNYNSSDVCKNEMGAAWALSSKRTLPFVLPDIKFEQMGFLNVVKQGASLLVGAKLDEFYKEICEFYNIEMDWISFNKTKEDFIDIVKTNLSI